MTRPGASSVGQSHAGARLAQLAAMVLLEACACGHSGAVERPAAGPGMVERPADASPGAAAISEPGGLPAHYRLVWSDEFDRAGLPDTSKWKYDTALNKTGWPNHELEYYSAARA